MRAVPLVLGVALGCSSESGLQLEMQIVPFSSIAAANGRTIAGGSDGRLYATDDGTAWRPFLRVSAAEIFAVHRDDTIELAVGGPYFARGLTSDWVRWELENSSLYGAGACLGSWWVTGSGGVAATTMDGTNWIVVGGIHEGADLIDLACGGSTILLASYLRQSGHWISEDGTTFTNVPSPADTCGVTHADGAYFMLAVDGRVYTAPDDDAEPWTEIARIPWPEPVPYCTVEHDDDMFCISGDDSIHCCDSDWSCTELPIPQADKVPVYDIVLVGGVLQAVGEGGWFLRIPHANGEWQEPEISIVEVSVLAAESVPYFPDDGGGMDSADDGSCDPCTSDADCDGVAERNGVPGAACGDDGLCYACFQACGAGGTNCRCIECSEGCGPDAMCTGGTLCTFGIDGKAPCE